MPRLVATVLIAILILACSQEEEVAPTEAPSLTSPPTDAPPVSTTPQPTSPPPSLTPIPCPTGDCSRISMQMQGPANASRGQSLTYVLSYEVKNVRNTGIIVSYHPSLLYLSSRLASGTGQIVAEPARDGLLSWALDQGIGSLEITFQVKGDAALERVAVGAYEPGTETTQSNTINTAITS